MLSGLRNSGLKDHKVCEQARARPTLGAQGPAPHFRSSGLRGWGQSGWSPPAGRCLHLRLPSPGNKWWIKTSQALRFLSVWRCARAQRPLPAVQGDRPHPTLQRSGSPLSPPPPRAGPRRQRGPVTLTRDFLFFFAAFRLFSASVKMKQTSRPPPRHQTHTHTHAPALTHPRAGLPAGCVRGGTAFAQTPAGRAERGARHRLSSARRLPGARARSRCPLPRRSARRRAGRSAAAPPPRHAPPGSGGGGAATVRAAEGAAGAGSRGAVQTRARTGSADQVGPAGRRPNPRRPRGAGPRPGGCGRGVGMAGGRGAGHHPGPALLLPCLCPCFCSCCCICAQS